ncbi:titin-like, partial [Alosa sapidissima]|uniref:titin-like n=1 Tax=Alosa sapidissima TaxID=34773 RepID=UPI001C099387
HEVSALEYAAAESLPIRHVLIEYLYSASYSSPEKCVATKTKTKVVEEVKEIKATLSAKIITKSQSTTVSIGETARFTCDIDGEPAPRLTWLHEGTTIVSSHRYLVTTPQYKSTFEIISVEISHEGNYIVMVENSEGTQEARFSLPFRKPPPKQEVPAPLPSVKSPEPEVKSPELSQVTSPEPRVKSPESVKSPEPFTSPSELKSPSPVKSSEPVTPPQRVASPPTVKSPEPITSPPRVKSPTIIKSPEPILSPRRVKSPPRVKSLDPVLSPKWVKSPTKTAPPKIVQQLIAEASEDKVKIYCVAENMVVKEVVWYKGRKKMTQGSIYGVSESDQGEYTCEITTEGRHVQNIILFHWPSVPEHTPK